MSLASKYYRLLNLPSTASVSEIKKAYRAKAKQLHPDLNPSPNAEEDFVELNEAYEYLIALKTKGNNKKQYQQVNDFEKWWRAEEANRREKARKQAQMRYEEYINSTDYKLNNAFDVISFYVLLVFIAAIPTIFFFIFYDNPLAAVVMFSIASSLLYHLLKPLKSDEYSPSALVKAIGVMFNISNKLIPTKFWLAIPFISVFNFYTLYTAVLDTFITTTNLVLLYLGIPVFLYLAFLFLLKKHALFIYKRTICFVTLPLLFNILFIINYQTATNESIETYHYRIDFKTKSVNLKGSKYQEYWGVRTIIKDYDEFLARNHITYTIKEGALGLKVVSDYELFLSFDNI